MPRIDSPEEWAIIRETYFDPPVIFNDEVDPLEQWDREIRKKKRNGAR